MRDSRFIELLNLYIDHQLTAAEAAELEKEISNNLERRTTYNQYCRMQKACSELFEHERSLAPSSRVLCASLSAVERKVDRSAERRFAFGIQSFAAVGLAAAACVAFVVIVSRGPRGRSGSEIASAPAAIAPVTITQVSSSPETTAPGATAALPSLSRIDATMRPSMRESLFVSSVRPFGTDDSPSELMLDSVNGESVASYDWMHDVELTPVASLSDRITLQPTNTSFASRSAGLRRTGTTAVEHVAFQFQR